MNWIAASLLSAFFLGIYELLKKHAVRDNAVLPAVFLSTLAGATVWLLLMAVHAGAPAIAFPKMLTVSPLSAAQHGQLFLKSAIVSASWVCSYFALKHLPVSIASPISSSSPMYTLLGAIVLLGERPSALQWLGIATALGSFFGLSLAGRREGIHFHRDKWVWFMIAGAILNGISGLYDKFLLGRAGFTASTVQAWFSIYLAVLFLPLALGWKWHFWRRGEFHWRWSIPLVGLVLLIADFVYFSALRNPQALVSVVASIRRGNVLVAFCGGLLFFGEQHGWRKLAAIIGVLVGILLTVLG
jgi:drug/metabolite transporter (DMT)-like permease